MTLSFFVALALALWGVTTNIPTIIPEFFQEDIGIPAQTGCVLGGEEQPVCFIGVHEATWNTLTPAQRQGLMLHEVGHTLGLGHFGDCNSMPANMGCWPIPEPTAKDLTELWRIRDAPYRLGVPVAYDGPFLPGIPGPTETLREPNFSDFP